MMRKISTIIVSVGMLMVGTVQAAITEPVASNTGTVSKQTEPVLDDVVVMDALHEFKSLTRVERKMRMKEAKKLLKNFKAQQKAGDEPSTNTVLLAILAVLLPPLAVYLKEGTINGKFWLSVLLSLLFWLPGVIYALIVVLG